MHSDIDYSGRELGRYRLISLLGAGGMGAVYDALDPSLGRHVAVKILPPDFTSDSTRVRRFVQEARTASSLNHPHLISIFDIGRETVDGEELQFIAMEKIDGRTLRETLNAGPMPRPRALELMAQIADAVAAAHAAGVIHRDLKPENIMIATSGYPKVLDFGLAKLEEPAASNVSTATGVVVGTAGYMAPEQAQGHAADARSDIFALGCVLYEVITGQRAFQGRTAIDTMHAVVHAEPEPMTGVAPELQRIVRKALAKNPDDRYQTARDLAIDLREAARASMWDGLSARPGGLRARPTLIVAALLIIAAAAIVWIARRPAPAPVVPHIRPLTTTGDVIEAAISPDGRYLAYVTSRAEGQRIWLRQLATGQDLQVVPPMAASGSWGLTFTPDGNSIVFVIKNRDNGAGTLYQVPTIGGPPRHLPLTGIDCAVSFSPDGKRFAYVRADTPARGESALMVANADGTGAHPIAIRKYPDAFAPLFFTGVSWSPDGAMIVAPEQHAGNPNIARLAGISSDGQRQRYLTDGRWAALAQPAWLPDGSGIILIGAEPKDAPRGQVWLLSEPSGALRPLTNDLYQYRLASVSSDGKSIVTVAGEASSEIWSVPLDDPSKAHALNRGASLGLRGITVAADGRIIFTSSPGGDGMYLVSMNADGSGARDLTPRNAYSRFPAVWPGGIAYIDTSAVGNEIRTMNADGEGQRVIVHGVDDAPIDVARDGSFAVYTIDRRLWRIRMDGRNPRQLTTDPVTVAAVAPSGDRIAMLNEHEGKTVLTVIDAARGNVLWTAPGARHTFGSTVRWTPDGRALLVNDHEGDRSNLWKVPFDDAPVKLTDFRDETGYAFALTPDEKTVIFSRAELRRDAVLITDFR